MKVFLSMPMNGLTIDEIRTKMQLVFALFKKNVGRDDLELIDSVVDCDSSEYKHGSVFCIGESLKRLANADIAVFLDGYDKARGCMIECNVCKKYGIPSYVYILEYDLVARCEQGGVFDEH